MTERHPALSRLEEVARNWRGHITLHADHGSMSPEWTCQLAYMGVARTPDGQLVAQPANWYATGPTLTAAVEHLLAQIDAQIEAAVAAATDPPGDTP